MLKFHICIIGRFRDKEQTLIFGKGPRWPSGLLIGLSRRRDRFDPSCRLWVYTSNHRSLRGIKLLDSSLVSSSASYDLINFDLWPGIVCPERDFGLLVSRRIHSRLTSLTSHVARNAALRCRGPADEAASRTIPRQPSRQPAALVASA